MILCELVPREKKQLMDESMYITKTFPLISGINIPDVLRLKIRSYDAASFLLNENITPIPHIRAMDLPLNKTVKVVESLYKNGLRSVLIVTGDIPTSLSVKIFPVTPLHIIESLKKKCPKLTVYAAIDPYRDSFQNEFSYAKQKRNAGCDGFFTQPFFDPKLASIYCEQLSHSTLFIGISPVTSETSKNYWITRNKAIFPKEFKLNFEYNIQLAKKIMAIAEEHKQHTYLMPIKVNPINYLERLFF